MTSAQPESRSQDRAIFRLFDQTLDGLAAICKVMTGIALVVLTVTFGWLVFGRYVLNETPTWVEQTALLLVMLIAFLGAAVGVHEHTHLSVTLLRTAVPRWLRNILLFLSDLIMGGFGFAMVWFGTTLTVFKWGSDIPLIQMPEGLRSLPLAVGGGLIVLFSVGHILRMLRGRDQRQDIIG